MAEIIEDRVQETSTTTGTGSMFVAGAVTSFRTFSSVCSVGDQFYGVIVAVDANGAPTGAWECGHYTYSAANTITRTTVTSSSNNNALVNFGSGVKRIFIDVVAAQVRNFQSNATSSGAGPYGQDASEFTPTPVFSEEFSGNGLDTSVWNTSIYYESPDSVVNYAVSNGYLGIWPATGFVNRTLDTDGKFYLFPGSYVEAKIKFNTGLGLNSAFWLYNHDATDHPGVTIAKTFCGATSTGFANSLYHPTNYRVSVDSSDSVNVGGYNAGTYASLTDLSSDYHIYAVKWESDGFTFYYDGVAVGAKISHTQSLRMYILLTNWFSSASSNGSPTTASTPTGQGNAMQVDYVRAWTLV